MAEKMTLEPCPFCGGEAVAENYIVEAQAVCLGCRAKIVRSHGAHTDNGLQEAIEAWNRRAHIAQPAQAVDADAWRACYGTIIRALAAIVNYPQTDAQLCSEVIPRDPVMVEVYHIRQALDDFSKTTRATGNAQAVDVVAIRKVAATLANAGRFDIYGTDEQCDDLAEKLTRAIGTAQAEGAWAAEARRLYNASVGDAHNLHCLAWSELSKDQQRKWISKASTAPSAPEGTDHG